MAWTHRILGVDQDANTANCAHCGTVKLSVKEGRPICSVARSQRRRRADGSTRPNSKGYVLITVNGHEMSLHRHVMEQHLGRKLLPHEEVHHKNGDRSDNDLGNLELWSTKQPKGQRVEDKLTWAREIIELYGHMDEPGA